MSDINLEDASFYDVSHPDIDSGLESYFREEEYCFRSKKANEKEYCAILKMKKGKWVVSTKIEQSKIALFDGTDELIIYVIDKIVGTKEKRKAFRIILCIAGIV